MIKRKILMVGPFPPTVGGITSYMQTILKSNLNEIFHFIPFTTSRPTFGVVKDVYDYTLIFRIGLNYFLKSLLTTLKHIIIFPLILFMKKPKIIHIHTPDYWPFWESSIYIIISKLFRKKIILHIHATSFHLFYNTGNDFVKILIRAVLTNCDKIIVLSQRQEGFFRGLVSKNKLAIMQNVIVSDDFQDININNKEYKSKIIKILFIGGEEAKRKGIYDVINAIPFVINKYGKNILFIFLGKCDNYKIKNMCKEKKIENYVKFLGYVTDQVKIEILNHSDIFVLPSYAEGMPIAILEAMASGLPIISTSVGSIPDIVKEEVNGYLINPGDYYTLANRIIILASNLILRKKIGEKNKKTIRMKYDVNLLTNKMKKLYNKLYII